MAGRYYVNLASDAYPNGEIRGQILPVPEPKHFATLGLSIITVIVVVRRRKRVFANSAEQRTSHAILVRERH